MQVFTQKAWKPLTIGGTYGRDALCIEKELPGTGTISRRIMEGVRNRVVPVLVAQPLPEERFVVLATGWYACMTDDLDSFAREMEDWAMATLLRI
jgi:hypothetical protein